MKPRRRNVNSHPSFITPDENTIIWHYMDFTKFVSLLEKQALFFSTIGILRGNDEHEGTYTPATVEVSKEKPFSIHDIGSDLLRSFGRMLAANCWHMNEIESVAMWKVYLRNNPGVAIQSTVKSLSSNLDRSKTQRDIHIGKIHYLSEADVVPEPEGFNGMNAVLWKWQSYQYENEVRAVVLSPVEEYYKYNGVYIPIDLDSLIHKIVISPKAPRWYSELITSISDKYGLGEKIASSRLDIKPGNIDNDMFSIDFVCPLCNEKQEFTIDPFVVKEYPQNLTVVFSADRVSVQCQNCEKFLVIPLTRQTENPSSDQ